MRSKFTAACAALTMTALAVPGVALGATNAASASPTAGTVNYAIGKPVCKPVKPADATCFAVRRVLVKKGTPGARPFELVRSDATAAKAGPAATVGPAGGLTPSDLATAYGFSSTATGTGQTVAVVDAFNDPNINADLQTFDSQYGLASCSTSNGCLTVVNQTGGLTPPANDTTGWSMEESLDVETVHSACQNCKILLVEANDQAVADLAASVNEAVKLKANEISNSYGFPESQFTAADDSAYNHPGTVITASSGDNGYYAFDYLGEFGSAYNAIYAPASLNTVVAVGGTSLYLGQTATRQSETVWNDNGTKDYWEQNFGQALGAAGGGCSTVTPAPLWQTNLAVWSTTDCGTHRSVADVSAVADYLTGFDVYDSYNCGSSCRIGWSTIGGTSLSSPLIASMFGLAGGAHAVKNPALTLYGHLGSSVLYDVTSGGNGYCDGEGAASCGDPNTLGSGILDCDYPATGTTPNTGDRACDALVGYDGPTGVGTPNGLGAFAKTGPKLKVAGPTSIAHGTLGTWTTTATDPFPAGTVTSYKWSWGDGSANTVTTTGSATHAYTGAATATITVTATDNYGATGSATHPVNVS